MVRGLSAGACCLSGMLETSTEDPKELGTSASMKGGRGLEYHCHVYSRGFIERTLPSLGAHLITAELFFIIHMPNEPQMGMNTEELLLVPLYDLQSFLESQAYLCAHTQKKCSSHTCR